MDYSRCIAVLETFPWARRSDYENIYDYYLQVFPAIEYHAESEYDLGLGTYYTLESLSRYNEGERGEYVERILSQFSPVDEDYFEYVGLDDDESDDLVLYNKICAGEVPEDGESDDSYCEEEVVPPNQPSEEYLRIVEEMWGTDDSQTPQIHNPEVLQPTPATSTGIKPPKQLAAHPSSKEQDSMRPCNHSRYIGKTEPILPTPQHSVGADHSAKRKGQINKNVPLKHPTRRKKKGRSADDLDLISPKDGIRVIFKLLNVPENDFSNCDSRCPLHPLAPDGKVGLQISNRMRKLVAALRT